MAIIVNLDVMLARRNMRLTELSIRVDISVTNASNLTTGKARAIRFSTLESICEVLSVSQATVGLGCRGEMAHERQWADATTVKVPSA